VSFCNTQPPQVLNFKACTGWLALVSSRLVTANLSIGLLGPVELRRFVLDYLLVCSDTVWCLQTSSIICLYCIHYRQYTYRDLTFMGPCIANIFQYVSNNVQLYIVYLYLETALHVSGVISTHHQERIQIYLQHLVFVTPLLLPAAPSR
jgi:hypothetical protein